MHCTYGFYQTMFPRLCSSAALSKYQSNININRKNKNIRIFCLQNVDID